MDAEKSTLENEIIRTLSEELDIPLSEITVESHLTNDLGIDSFKAVELLFILKDRFNVEFSPEEFRRLIKVIDIVTNISKKRNR